LIRIFDDPGATASAVAERIVETAVACIGRHGEFRIGLAGGRTPRRAYRILAGDLHLDWRRTTILFTDERGVPPDHPDSNYRMVRESLLDPAGVPAERVRRLHGEAADLDAAARDDERHYEDPADLLVLGVGPDGHTASIFPGGAAATERVRGVVAVLDSPKPPSRRLTITPRVIGEARSIVVLATGADKADAVAAALEGEVDASRMPARLLRNADWYLDRAASLQLTRV
jgi:6-phosphogluconolactonase